MMSIIAEIIRLVRLELGLRKISASDRFFEDLGIDSSDLLNVLVAVEEKYGVTIQEEEVLEIQTVNDLAVRVTRKTE